MVDETALVIQLRRKSRGAIDKAIKAYTPYLSTVLYNMVGNSLPKEDIEEIISDTFVSLWKNADYIDIRKGTIRSYIAATARHFALKRLNRRMYASDIDGELPDGKDFCEEILEAEAVWKAVMELGEPDNEIFVRFYKYDESLKCISSATGLNISTIKSKLSRGKRKLKKILNREESL